MKTVFVTGINVEGYTHATIYFVKTSADLPLTGTNEGDVGICLETGLFYQREVNTNGWTLKFDAIEATEVDAEVDASHVDGLDTFITASIADELSTKADVAHDHAQADITNLASDLAGKAASVHSHAIGDTTGLQTAIDGKAAVTHGTTHEPGGSDAMSIALTQLSGSVSSQGNNTVVTPTSGKKVRLYYASYNPALSCECAWRFGAAGGLFLRNNLTTGGRGC